LLQNAPGVLLAPVPLALLQPMLSRIASHVAQSRPELFNRLGPHAGKRFLIDPIDLPFVLVLTPLPERPLLTAHRRYERPAHAATIAGTFFNLLDMIDGSLDGDALFFSRDLQVSGDTEAVVALRNALDDFEGSALDSVVASFGPLSAPAALALSVVRAVRGK
jgi:predicted lipid carrier protein YhbT